MTDCIKWFANPLVNPNTKRKITETGPVYKKLQKECGSPKKPKSPVKVVKPKSPVKVVKPKSPVKVVKPKSPVKVVKPKSPVKVVKPKSPVKVSDPNKELIEELSILLDQAKMSKEPSDKFRVKAYNDAIQKIKQMDKKIRNEEDIPLKKTSKIYLKIKEFISRGKIKQSEKARSEKGEEIRIYNELMKISGIGPVKAKQLIAKGIKKIADLEKNVELLNKNQVLGLRHYKSEVQKIPREEMKKHEKVFEKVAEECDGLLFSITGSYRRGLTESGDIDVLLTHEDDDKECFRMFVDGLIEEGYIVDTISYGKKKYMGYGKLKDGITRRIDIMYSPPQQYPFSLLYFTGPGPFNEEMRKYAKKKGYKLSEKNLIELKTGKEVNNFTSERDIFAFLNIPYLKPEKRTTSVKF